MINEIKPTQRGFNRGEFKDAYGMSCSIQESSADGNYLWLGINDPEPQIMAIHANDLGLPNPTNATTGWVPYKIPHQVLLSTRMHLNEEQVKNLIETLQIWLDTGSLSGK